MTETGRGNNDLVRLITMTIDGKRKFVMKEDRSQFGDASGQNRPSHYECDFQWDGRTEQTVTLLADLLRNAAAHGTLPNEGPLNSAAVDQIAYVLGYHLYDLLFGDDKTNALLRDALDSYQERKLRFVRIVLEFVGNADNVLSALPWEYVRIPPGPDGPQYLVHTSQFVLHRRLHLSDAVFREFVTEDPLKVLVVAASPVMPEQGKERPLPPVSAAAVSDKLNTLKATLGERLIVATLEDPQLDGGRPGPDYRPGVTRALLKAKIQHDEPHVVHFIGHGRRSADRGQLALSGEDGRPDWVDDEVFANIACSDDRDLRLVVLQACESALPSPYVAGASGVASQVALRRIPAVVAMQYSINATAANTFATSFYEALLGEQAVSVDVAVSRARQAMLSSSNEAQSSVSFPVVYLLDYHRLMSEPKGQPPLSGLKPVSMPAQTFPCPRPGCAKSVTTDDVRCSGCGLRFKCPVCKQRWDPTGIYCNKCEDFTHVKQPPWPQKTELTGANTAEFGGGSSFGGPR